MESGLLALVAMFLLVPIQWWQESNLKWQRLDPIEQSLQRASKGFALAVFAFGLPFVTYGAKEVGLYLVRLVTDPLSTWPAAVVVLVPMTVGFIRFWFGFQRLVQSGTRDGLRAVNGAVRMCIGIALALFIGFASWPWAFIGTSMIGACVLMFLLAAGIWNGITGAVRVTVLNWPQGMSAVTLVSEGIKADKFHWGRRAPLRRWWQMWKR